MKILLVLTSAILGSGLVALKTNKIHTSPTHLTASSKRSDAHSAPIGTVSIIIDKSDYELSVYDDKGWYATYPVVFGNNSLDDKKMEGDNNTPEGSFKIVRKRVHEKWQRFLAIDYPTKESWSRFNARKQRGEIPANATIGGGVGIHGTWDHEDFVVDRFKNWTVTIKCDNGTTTTATTYF